MVVVWWGNQILYGFMFGGWQKLIAGGGYCGSGWGREPVVWRRKVLRGLLGLPNPIRRGTRTGQGDRCFLLLLQSLRQSSFLSGLLGQRSNSHAFRGPLPFGLIILTRRSLQAAVDLFLPPLGNLAIFVCTRSSWVKWCVMCRMIDLKGRWIM